MIRRYAFKYGEGSFGHWIPLIVADRVNVVEGILDDLKHGHVPNIFAEKGWKAEWKHKPKRLVTKVLIGVAITAAVSILLSPKNKSLRKG
jgi:hypothetical protein